MKMIEPDELIKFLQDRGFKLNEESLKSKEFSFRIFPHELVQEETEELIKAVEASEYGDKTMLVNDSRYSFVVLLTEVKPDGQDKRYTIDHIIMALEAERADVEYILDKVLGGPDAKGYVRESRMQNK